MVIVVGANFIESHTSTSWMLNMSTHTPIVYFVVELIFVVVSLIASLLFFLLLDIIACCWTTNRWMDCINRRNMKLYLFCLYIHFIDLHFYVISFFFVFLHTIPRSSSKNTVCVVVILNIFLYNTINFSFLFFLVKKWI